MPETKIFKPPRIGITGVLKRRKEEKKTAENFPDLVKNTHLKSRCSTNSKLDKHKETPQHITAKLLTTNRVSRKVQEKTT